VRGLGGVGVGCWGVRLGGADVCNGRWGFWTSGCAESWIELFVGAGGNALAGFEWEATSGFGDDSILGVFAFFGVWEDLLDLVFGDTSVFWVFDFF
jgi:hypothetical protein